MGRKGSIRIVWFENDTVFLFVSFLRFLMFFLVVRTSWSVDLRGRITDSSQAVVAGAEVALSGSTKLSVVADSQGEYRFTGLVPGRYSVFAAAPQLALPKAVSVTVGTATVVLNLELRVSRVSQRLDVQEAADNALSADTRASAAALVLRGADLDILADKPEDLAADLMALAGPSAGPNGGAIFIDGFSGGQLPSKDAIR